MRRFILEIAIAAALTLAAILSLATHSQANEIMVSGAYARASATPVAKTGAIYFTLMNHGSAPDRLVAASTDVAQRAEFHDNVVTDGVNSMRRTDKIDLAPGSNVTLTPGGLHLMLFGLKRPLKEGDRLTLTLAFERAGTVPVEVTVGAVAAGAMEGMDH